MSSSKGNGDATGDRPARGLGERRARAQQGELRDRGEVVRQECVRQVPCALVRPLQVDEAGLGPARF